MRLGKFLFFLWLFALAQGAQAVAAPSKNAFQYDECVSGSPQEYWDQDSQLLYLRARWYDPKLGRFISADPFEGRQQDPRSLNRYAYAHNSPVGGTDPTGRMTLGEVGTTLSNIGSMATRAYNAYDLVSSIFGGEDEGTVDGKGGLWDSLLATSVNALAGSVSVPAAGGGGGRSSGRGPRNPDGHHTVPKYMCGHKDQWKVHLSQVDHTVMHRELEFLKHSINAAGLLLDRAFRKSRPPAQRDAIVRLSRTIAGRAAIAKGLHLFYTTFDWWNEGIPFGIQPFGAHTIGELFPYEAARFIANHHSYPTCTAH